MVNQCNIYDNMYIDSSKSIYKPGTPDYIKNDWRMDFCLGSDIWLIDNPTFGNHIPRGVGNKSTWFWVKYNYCGEKINTVIVNEEYNEENKSSYIERNEGNSSYKLVCLYELIILCLDNYKMVIPDDIYNKYFTVCKTYRG